MRYAWALFLNEQGIVTVIKTSLLPSYLNCIVQYNTIQYLNDRSQPAAKLTLKVCNVGRGGCDRANLSRGGVGGAGARLVAGRGKGTAQEDSS